MSVLFCNNISDSVQSRAVYPFLSDYSSRIDKKKKKKTERGPRHNSRIKLCSVQMGKYATGIVPYYLFSTEYYSTWPTVLCLFYSFLLFLWFTILPFSNVQKSSRRNYLECISDRTMHTTPRTDAGSDLPSCILCILCVLRITSTRLTS